MAETPIFGDRKVYSVTQLAAMINESLRPLRGFYLRGEVRSAPRIYRSMVYMSVGEAGEGMGAQSGATINVVMFLNDLTEDERELLASGEGLEGKEVMILVKYVNFYEKKGTLSVIGGQIVLGSEGAIALRRAQILQRLAKDGILDRPRKEIPPLPRVVGVVTSRNGAAIRDFLKIARDPERMGALIILAHATVEGKNAPSEVIAALRALDSLEGEYEPDVIVITRGGGSADDLAVFDDEAISRAAAEARHPVISAIGHERDWVVLDQVADLRLATPTDAAQYLFPLKGEFAAQIQHMTKAMTRAMEHHLLTHEGTLSGLKARLVSPRERLDEQTVYLMEMVQAMERRMRKIIEAKGEELGSVASRLGAVNPSVRVERTAAMVLLMRQRMDGAVQRLMERTDRELELVVQRLGSLDPHGPIRRGYALVKRTDGRVVTRPSDVEEGDRITITVRDGSFGAVVSGGRARTRTPDKKRKPGRGESWELF